MAWKKTAKENQIPNTTPLVAHVCSMMHQAYGAMRWPEVVAAFTPTEGSTPLYHGIATTHTQRLPGDVAGAVGGQKRDSLRDIFGEPKAAEGIEPDDAGFQVEGEPLGRGGGFGKARTDAIDVDVI